MSLGEFVEETLADCDALPVRDLHAIAEWVDERAAPVLYQLADETGRSELPDAVAVLGRAREALDQVLQLVDSATRTLRAYCERQSGGSGPTGSLPAQPAAEDRRLTQRERLDRLENARRRLPPPTPGARTCGTWVDERGHEHQLVSGNRDEWFVAAAEFARERGWVKGRAVLGLARHAEVKFAMRMRAMEVRRGPGAPPLDETIAIDRPPCGVEALGEWTCDVKLADFLPPGASLTVIDRSGNRYVYRGSEEG